VLPSLSTNRRQHPKRSSWPP